jgi:ligand-binding SRPBCC domain-containing protein
MPRIVKELHLARPIDEVFDFFCQPANLVRTLPPDLNLTLVEGPPRLHLGAVLTVKGRRWGVTQTVRSEIIAFESPTLFTEQQRQGPFGKWVHCHRFEAVKGKTRVADEIDFEPPGGILGLLVSVSFLEQDLERILSFRNEKLRELLGD